MIEIVNPGPGTSVQDAGRGGFMRFGVSRSGAMDDWALAAANLLVGNARHKGALEAALTTPAIRFLDDTVFALTGGRCEALLDGAPVEMDTPIFARAGQQLAAAPIVLGCRTYLSFAGGLGLTPALGSVSCDARAGLGGLRPGEKLRRGDRLPVALPKDAAYLMGRRIPQGMGGYIMEGEKLLRVTDGPQRGALSPAGEEAFFSNEYAVLPESDRMGIRFSGAALAFNPGQDGNIITDALARGAVQVTGAGLPIVMMAQAQTTGGYAKPFWLIGADLRIAAQLRPGDRVRFAYVPLAAAQAELREREDAFARLEAHWGTKTMRVKVGQQAYKITVREVFSS